MKVSIVSEVSIDGKLTFGRGKNSKELFSLLTTSDIEYIHKLRGKATITCMNQRDIVDLP